MIFGLLAMILRDSVPLLSVVSAGFADVLFCIYFIHNTQKVKQSQDIAIAVIIFLAHINIFIFITLTLQLLETM